MRSRNKNRRRSIHDSLLVIALLTALGCGAQKTPTGTTSTLSGTVSGAGSGVIVTLGGSATATTTTDATGKYAFTELSNGAYSVAPTSSGFVYTPVSAIVTLQDASVEQNFAAAAYSGSAYSISGNVSGAIADGVTVTLSGDANGKTLTDSSGNYSFGGLMKATP